jgi:hypothetical protein
VEVTVSDKPLKIMYLNPVADNPEVDPIFADMARFDAFGSKVPVFGSRIVVEAQ